MPNDVYECPKVLLNVDWDAKIVIKTNLCASVGICALMNVSSHYWSPLQQMIAYLIVMNSKRCKITVFRKHSMHKGRSLARGVHLFDAQWENNQVTKKVRLHVLLNNTNFVSVATVFESKNIRTHVKFPDKVLLLSIIQSTINFI